MAPDGTSHPLQRLHERDDGRCWLCYDYCEIQDATRDHVIPVSLGGAYAWANFALAHGRCNGERADRFPVARYNRFTVRAQQRAWDRSGGRCERCGIGTGLVFDQAPWATDLSVLCTDCRWGTIAYRGLLPDAAPQALSATTADLVPAQIWDRLLAVCTEPEQPAQEQAVLVGVADVQDDLVEDLAQPQPVIPVPRPKPRFTPLDHARQAAQATARAAELEAAKAAQEAAESLASVPVEEEARAPWIVRLWRRVAFWRREER